MSTARAAIYWAPHLSDPLHMLGSAWLGRDAEAGAARPQPTLNGIDVAAITSEARMYGLHATLKPPFRLAGSYAALHADAKALAARVRPFVLPPMYLADHHGFLALLQSKPSEELQALCDACVCDLDHHRAPPTEAEIRRRNPDQMTLTQRELTMQWGYPYVFGEWLFHITLSRCLTPSELPTVRSVLAAHLGEAPSLPRRVTEVCLFTQAEAGAPFLIAERLPLLG